MNKMTETSVHGLSQVTWSTDPSYKEKAMAEKAKQGIGRIETVEDQKECAITLCDHIERRNAYVKDLLLGDALSQLTLEEAQEATIPLYAIMDQCDEVIEVLRGIRKDKNE